MKAAAEDQASCLGGALAAFRRYTFHSVDAMCARHHDTDLHCIGTRSGSWRPVRFGSCLVVGS